MMKVRNKISYHALVKQMTIRELFFTSILNTYKQLGASRRAMAGMREYKRIDKDVFN